MFFNKNKKESQLYFDFTGCTSAVAVNDKNPLERVSSVKKVGSGNEIVFHRESSNILKDRFSIKVNYLGRSYLVKGTYKITGYKTFSDFESITNQVSNVVINEVLSFRDRGYFLILLPKKDIIKIEKFTKEVLSNMLYNQNLEII